MGFRARRVGQRNSARTWPDAKASLLALTLAALTTTVALPPNPGSRVSLPSPRQEGNRPPPCETCHLPDPLGSASHTSPPVPTRSKCRPASARREKGGN